MCGIAVIRLKKTLEYFEKEKGDPLWHFSKLKLLMSKLRNRGQCGVGFGAVKTNLPQGEAYMFRDREATKKDPLGTLFDRIENQYKDLQETYVKEQESLGLAAPTSIPAGELKKRFDSAGEIIMGHLRYTTSGEVAKLTECHPYSRRSTWAVASMLLAGNFNIANAEQLNEELANRGQSPVKGTDTQTVIESVAYHIDRALEDIVRSIDAENLSGDEIRDLVSEKIDIESALRKATRNWDGGYVISGVLGNGDMFIFRDPRGIRPCYCYESDELYAYSSERVTLMTAFEVEQTEIEEVLPGQLHILKNHDDARMVSRTVVTLKEPLPLQRCSFERVYFSRGNDPEIYRERKNMGEALAAKVHESIGGDFNNTVFSFIPNTAEMGYYGLMEGLRKIRRRKVREDIKNYIQKGEVSEEELDSMIMDNWPRVEKIALKDEKMRTFIAAKNNRVQMTNMVYDISYDVIKRNQDALVVIDDSIVRGNTLNNSIVRILARTEPTKLIVCSTAPQIRYPDCYGIDMVSLDTLIAFRAAHRLASDELLEKIYNDCIAENQKPKGELIQNQVRQIYQNFEGENSALLSKKIAELSRPDNIAWEGEIEVIYLDTDDFHDCLTGNSRDKKLFGDWYFTGNYPTNAGNFFANQCYIDWFTNPKRAQKSLPLAETCDC